MDASVGGGVVFRAWDEDKSRPIGTLAREWGCDPTCRVDRLERTGLAEDVLDD